MEVEGYFKGAKMNETTLSIYYTFCFLCHAKLVHSVVLAWSEAAETGQQKCPKSRFSAIIELQFSPLLSDSQKSNLIIIIVKFCVI